MKLIKRQKRKLIKLQKEDDSCGPVAFINMLRVFGYNMGYNKSIIDSFKMFGYKRKFGMDMSGRYGITNMLRFFKIKFHFERSPKGTDIIKYLENDNMVILLAPAHLNRMEKDNCTWLHFFFLHGCSDKNVLGANLFKIGNTRFTKKKLLKGVNLTYKKTFRSENYINGKPVKSTRRYKFPISIIVIPKNQ